MKLTPRQLAFLEYEMKEIINSNDRDGEDRSHASSVLGLVQGELENIEEKQLNGTTDPEELFS